MKYGTKSAKKECKASQTWQDFYFHKPIRRPWDFFKEPSINDVAPKGEGGHKMAI